MAPSSKTKLTLLGGIKANARALRDTERTLELLMVRAVKSGVTQTEIATAAGVSQAHVSRTIAAAAKVTEARKAQARSRRKREGRTV